MNDKASAGEGIAGAIDHVGTTDIAPRMQIPAACHASVRVHTPANAQVACDAHTPRCIKMSREANVASDIHCTPNANAPSSPDRAANAHDVTDLDIAAHLDRAGIDKGFGIDAIDNKDLVCRAELVHQPASIVNTAIGDKFIEQFLIVSAFSEMSKKPAKTVGTGAFCAKEISAKVHL
ncbi:hypothetical protein [Aromatoleum toluclasticum]|uniref:hypothetical protein n=1 Tax=Aromatoleum toluclasticum TaxID=92003 RepID=UPI002FC2D7D7